MDESDTPDLPPGTNINGAVVQERVKAGGYGTVYRARDELSGMLLAIKLIPLQARQWAERESLISLSLHHDNLVQQVGFGFWPDAEPRFVWLKMLYIEGRELDQWAWEENPDARAVVGKVLGVARGLAVVHDQGVVHRDVKEANILVRDRDGEPVLLDFGSARREGQATITEGVFPPGTPNYRSPEAWHFGMDKGRARGAHYRPGTADDLYALGVVLYRLLTGRYPFEVSWDYLDSVEAVIHRAPLPPRIVNARVPEVLSGVCMKLLEKKPQERHPSALALYDALEVLLARADESWRVPLRDSPLPPRRSRRDAAVRKKPAPNRRPALPDDEPTTSTSAPVTAAELPMQAMVLHALGRAAVGMAVLAGLAVAGGWLAQRWKSESQSPPSMSAAPSPTLKWMMSQEVAPSWPPPEAEWAAAPPPAMQTPAVVASLVTRPEDDAVKKPQASSAQGSTKQKGKLSPMARWCMGAAAVGNLACPGAPVRPVPESQACPEGAVETMTQTLDIRIGDIQAIQLPPDYEGSVQWIPVPNEGPTVVMTQSAWAYRLTFEPLNGKLPNRTLLLGRLYFREGRAYGRFTEAKTPQGDTFKVCMEMLGMGEGKKLGDALRDGKVFSGQKVRAVSHFE